MHRSTNQFWERYHELPQEVRERADKCFSLIRANPWHPSLHFKKTGHFWSARIDRNHRALAIPDGEDFIWVWIGSHDDYIRIIER